MVKDGVYKSGCQMCHGGCGILVHVREGKITKVEGNKDCPTNKGFLCVKGRHSLSFQYNPYRLLHPLKRVGDRGEGKWREISWEEAIETISDKLTSIRNEFGPEAVALNYGTKFPDISFVALIFSLCFGTPNGFGSGMAQCFLPRAEASVATFGKYHFPDFEGNPRCIVMWGDQTHITSHNHYNPARFYRALNKGAKLIVIDPRCNDMAERADIWLPVRPGTDAALALSMLYVILNERLYDQDIVKKWSNAPFLVRNDNNSLLKIENGDTSNEYVVWDSNSKAPKGFNDQDAAPELEGEYNIDGISCKTVWQKLLDRVEDFSPEKAERITWVPADKIREAARMYATVKPGTLLWGVPIDMLVNSHQNVRAIALLKAITGNLDVPGGNVYMPPLPHWDGVKFRDPKLVDRIPESTWQKQLGTQKYKLLYKTSTAHIPSLMDAILDEKPYPIKAMLTLGANPLICWANTKKTYKVLKKIDFSVVYELVMTPTAQLADLVLPAPTFFEKDRLSQTLAGAGCAIVVPKVVEPLAECRDEFEVMGDILRKCDLDQSWPWKTTKDFYDSQLRQIGLSWDQVKEQGWIKGPLQYRKYETDYYRKEGGFLTPSGKIEIFSSKYREKGYDPLPSYEEPPNTLYSRPDLAVEYPLIMTSGRIPEYFHSQYREVKELRDRHPEPIVQVHPETAKELSIADGDWVWIESPWGKCKQKVELFSGMDKRIIHTEHNWWFPEKEACEPSLSGAFESNINLLTSGEWPNLDAGFGSFNLRNIMCKIYLV